MTHWLLTPSLPMQPAFYISPNSVICGAFRKKIECLHLSPYSHLLLLNAKACTLVTLFVRGFPASAVGISIIKQNGMEITNGCNRRALWLTKKARASTDLYEHLFRLNISMPLKPILIFLYPISRRSLGLCPSHILWLPSSRRNYCQVLLIFRPSL